MSWYVFYKNEIVVTIFWHFECKGKFRGQSERNFYFRRSGLRREGKERLRMKIKRKRTKGRRNEVAALNADHTIVNHMIGNDPEAVIVNVLGAEIADVGPGARIAEGGVGAGAGTEDGDGDIRPGSPPIYLNTLSYLSPC